MVKVNVNKPKKSLLQRMNASVFWQNPCTPKSCSEWGCERLSVLSYASHAPELTYVDVNIGCVPSFAWLSGPPGDDAHPLDDGKRKETSLLNVDLGGLVRMELSQEA